VSDIVTVDRRSLGNRLADEVSRVAGLRTALHDADVTLDANEWLDAIEGETNFQEAIEQIAMAVLEVQGQIAGVEHQIDKLGTRKARLKALDTTLRGIALAAMDRAEVKTIRRPTVTATVKPVPQKVADDIDEALVPSAYFEPQPPKLNKAKVLQDLKEGRDVPGARLTNGGITIQMRFN
jgi:hypothetical protein